VSRRFAIAMYEGHDSSIAIVGEGQIHHFEAERFTGRKHDEGAARRYLEACMAHVGLTWDDIVIIVEPSLAGAWSQWWPNLFPYPDGKRANEHRHFWDFADQIDTGGTAHIPNEVNEPIATKPLARISHHMSHAAYAFYTSPFPEAGVMTMDGGGDAQAWGDGSWGTGDGYGFIMGATVGQFSQAFGSSQATFNVKHPKGQENSVGAAWSSLALNLTGNVNDAGTVMALGSSQYDHPMRPRIIELQKRTNGLFERLVQQQPHRAICLAGGCALNGIASYHLLANSVIDHLWVPPAVNDGGLTVGAALFGLHALAGVPRTLYAPGVTAYAGWGIGYRLMPDALAEQVARLIVGGQIVAVFQGRAESGPRALGHRSILADPTRPGMKDRLNLIKKRQPYRPVAPVITHEFAASNLHLYDPDAYYFMTCIADAKPQAYRDIPAGLHEDGSARIQIATPESGLTGIITALEKLGRPPCVLNTSFNRKGYPIVHESDNAKIVARELGLDAIVVQDELTVLA